ncbi:hypothetical protein J8273_6489 [Carpediemonas membranifera]|uniref:Uncharacterized protein n=1 Tax=Carpediemonas membranifera TaxID=201153 RepID=A0A8J6AYR0_9EUKA|nr:hypothetical protein J8273_6489 [Carpediemonas membranifera]|eukprot:KAG9391713.1 hypothetical protein J8273_6489 [Carpediemonas membranifera]
MYTSLVTWKDPYLSLVTMISGFILIRLLANGLHLISIISMCALVNVIAGLVRQKFNTSIGSSSSPVDLKEGSRIISEKLTAAVNFTLSAYHGTSPLAACVVIPTLLYLMVFGNAYGYMNLAWFIMFVWYPTTRYSVLGASIIFFKAVFEGFNDGVAKGVEGVKVYLKAE